MVMTLEYLAHADEETSEITAVERSLCDSPLWERSDCSGVLCDRASERAEVDSSNGSFTLQSTSSLVPVLAELDLNRIEPEDTKSAKLSPQYVGRRFSAARRSAQVLPEEVQALLQNEVKLHSFGRSSQILSQKPDTQAASRRWSESSVVTTRHPGSSDKTYMTGHPPGSSNNMKLSSNWRPSSDTAQGHLQGSFSRANPQQQPAMTHQSCEVRLSLQHAKETAERQHQMLGEMNNSLQNMMLRLHLVETAAAESSRCGEEERLELLAKDAQIQQLHEEANSAAERAMREHANLVAQEQRIRELESRVSILQAELLGAVSKQQRSQASADEASLLAERLVEADRRVDDLSTQLALDGNVIVKLRGDLQAAEAKREASAADAARQAAHAEAVSRENAYLQERLSLLGQEADSLRLQLAYSHAAVLREHGNVMMAAAPMASERLAVPSASLEAVHASGGLESSNCGNEPLEEDVDELPIDRPGGKAALRQLGPLQVPPLPLSQPDTAPLASKSREATSRSVLARATDSSGGLDAEQAARQRAAGIVTPRNGYTEIIKNLPGSGANGPVSTPRTAPKPYATDASLQEFMQRTKQLEDRLMEVNGEKDMLQGVVARLPENGRTLAERSHKAAAESRLADLAREAGTIRMHLKEMGAM